jgi:hypothetical protein
MEIRINDQPLAFRLENERTLGEVLSGLEQWLAGSELVLCEALCAGRDLLASPAEEWSATPPGEVQRLELTVRHASELRQENLRTMQEFLRAARDFAAGHPAAGPAARIAEELLRGYPLFLESLRRHFSEAEVGARLEGLAALGAGLGPQELCGLDAQALAALAAAASTLEEAIGRRLAEAGDPRAALARLSSELETTAAGISEVSVLLATGRDRQAMEAVVRFSELCQRLLPLLGSLGVPAVGGREPAEFFAGVNGVLQDLLAAFQARDTVLIGDLLEYEIAPRLRQLQAAL